MAIRVFLLGAAGVAAMPTFGSVTRPSVRASGKMRGKGGSTSDDMQISQSMKGGNPWELPDEVRVITEDPISGKEVADMEVTDNMPRNGIVKIFLEPRIPDFQQPWVPEAKQGGTCTGFVILMEIPVAPGPPKPKRRRTRQSASDEPDDEFVLETRIMTNAHCVKHVENAQVLVKRPGAASKKFTADVEYVSQQADLAVLKIANEDRREFNDVDDGQGVIEFAAYPSLETLLVVRGFPGQAGENNLLMVDGHISRMTTRDYSMIKEFTGGKAHKLLTIQTQAPVNSGNSGGPGFQKDIDGRWKCVGVVVEGDAGAKDNVGFLIPVQVVRHFLIDIKRRMMDPSHPMGFPGAGGLSLQSAEKKSTRTMFAIPDTYPGQGLVVMSECPTGSTFDGVLKKFDVLLEVDGHAITTTGMYQPRYEDEGLTEEVHMNWLFAKHHYGDTITVKVIRVVEEESQVLELEAVMKPNHQLMEDILTNPNGLAISPKYAIVGQMGVTEICRQYLSALEGGGGILAMLFGVGGGPYRSAQLTRAQALKLDTPEGFDENSRKIVTITDALGDDVDANAQQRIVKTVNGVAVWNLQHFLNLIQGAIEAARPLDDVPIKIRKDVGEPSMPPAEVTDAERLFAPEDFIEITLDPTLTVALGPIQRLYKDTISCAIENKIPVRNLWHGVDYQPFLDGMVEEKGDQDFWRLDKASSSAEMKTGDI